MMSVKNKYYGMEPRVVTTIEPELINYGHGWEEHVLIKEIGNSVVPRFKNDLYIKMVMDDFFASHNIYEWFVYFTKYSSIVEKGKAQNINVYHVDQVGTPDIQYIVHNICPTIFNFTQYKNIIPLWKHANKAFKEQADPTLDKTYPNFTVLKYDQYVVHRSPEVPEETDRTFIKISFSQNRYFSPT